MGYFINAWLENGIPQLVIRDARTGTECLRWARASTADTVAGEEGYENTASRALQNLFRELILLSCINRLSLLQHADQNGLGDECVTCQGCNFDIHASAKTRDVAAPNVISLQEWRSKKSAGFNQAK